MNQRRRCFSAESAFFMRATMSFRMNALPLETFRAMAASSSGFASAPTFTTSLVKSAS